MPHAASPFRFSVASVFTAASIGLVLSLAACNNSATGTDDTGGGGGPVVDDADLNGVFLRIDGSDYALGEADVYRYPPAGRRQMTAKYAGTTLFHGYRLNTVTVTVSQTLLSDSVQTCGSAATNAQVKLEFGGNFTAWGGTYTSTACQIKLDYLSQLGGLQGTISSATLHNDSGKTITLSNAKFRVFRYVGYTGPAPVLTGLSVPMATLQIDSGSFELTTGQHFLLSKNLTGGYGTSTTDGNAQRDGNASDAIVLGFEQIPQAGTWACNQSYSGGKTNISVKLGTYQSELYYSGIPANGSGSGAACSLLVVGQTNGAKMVTYSGTLVAADDILPLAKRRIKVSGKWKNFSLGKQLTVANEGTAGADSQEVLVTVDTGSWHFPAGGKYRGARTSVSKISGLPAYTGNFTHGGTNKDFTVSLTAVPSAAGTYTCGSLVPGTNPSQYRTSMRIASADTSGYYGIEYRAFTASESPGASCSITVAAPGGDTTLVTGTYKASLRASGAGELLPDGDTTLSVTGSFRMKKP